MGVVLDPRHDRMPTEEELARIAGLVPGDADRTKLEGLRAELDEKGFLVPARYLFNWARTGPGWMTFGLACFAVEMIHAHAAYDSSCSASRRAPARAVRRRSSRVLCEQDGAARPVYANERAAYVNHGTAPMRRYFTSFTRSGAAATASSGRYLRARGRRSGSSDY